MATVVSVVAAVAVDQEATVREAIGVVRGVIGIRRVGWALVGSILSSVVVSDGVVALRRLLLRREMAGGVMTLVLLPLRTRLAIGRSRVRLVDVVVEGSYCRER